MREQEMRLRVFRYLKARMRNMIMPATVGIGLAVGGACESAAVYSAPGPAEQRDASTWRQDVAMGPDAPGPDLAMVADVAAESVPDLAKLDEARTADALATEAGLDNRVADGKEDLPLLKYGSPFDSGFFDSRAVDAEPDAGQIIAKYIAPMPDAAVDSTGPAPRYMATMPDASADRSVVVLYMAQLPS
jgi:hypothetical protein